MTSMSVVRHHAKWLPLVPASGPFLILMKHNQDSPPYSLFFHFMKSEWTTFHQDRGEVHQFEMNL